MNRPAIPIEKRNVSAGTKAKILAATNHVCARPGCTIRATDVDHILPLWLGGSNREKNLEGLCPPHHAAKTKLEASLRAKAKRRAGETGNRAKKPIPGRKLMGGQKLQSGGFGGGPSKRALRDAERAVSGNIDQDAEGIRSPSGADEPSISASSTQGDR